MKMIENIKVSVIVPIHNAEEYLVFCINSILAQTHSKLELILVDDGSTDGSIDICKGQSDKRVMVFTQENKGVSSARNLGMQHASGDYITFIDADDWIMPDMLERLLQFAVTTASEIACCEYVSCTEHIAQKKKSDKIEVKCYDRLSFIREKLLGGDTRCWSKLYNRKLVQNIQFPEDISIGEDLLFLVGLLSGLNQVVYMTYKGYCYFNNGNGAMLEQFKPSYMDQITCWKITKEKMQSIVPEIDDQIGGKLLMAIMLVIGKLSKVKDKRNIDEYLIKCKQELKEACRIYGAKRYVDKGYRTKIVVFRVFPKLYLTMYGIWKH